MLPGIRRLAPLAVIRSDSSKQGLAVVCRLACTMCAGPYLNLFQTPFSSWTSAQRWLTTMSAMGQMPAFFRAAQSSFSSVGLPYGVLRL